MIIIPENYDLTCEEQHMFISQVRAIEDQVRQQQVLIEQLSAELEGLRVSSVIKPHDTEGKE